MYRLSVKTKKTYITKKQILKILYLAKTKMSDDNPIKNQLAYYWYLEGPHSEVVYESIDYLVSNGMVVCHKRKNSETYQYDSNKKYIPLVQPNNYLDESRKCITETVDDFNHTEDAVNDIYNQAPYAWYKTYKQEFKVKFDDFCKNIIANKKTMYEPKDILNILDDTVLDFPPLSEFIELRMIFMDFAKIINAFLRSEYLKYKDKFNVLQTLCNEIWIAFAYGVRVKHHDMYYDHRVDSWKNMYDEKINKLNKKILEQQKIFDEFASDNRRFTPEIEDSILYPEKHETVPVTPGIW